MNVIYVYRTIDECERYTYKHFDYSGWLLFVDIEDFVRCELSKSLSLCLTYIYRCVSTIDIALASTTTVKIY